MPFVRPYDPVQAALERGQLAAWLDGEGTFYAVRRKKQLVPRVRIQMSDQFSIYQVYRIAGYGSWGPTNMGMWQWTADGLASANFLAIWLGGLMSPRRQDQLASVIERCRVHELARRDGEVPAAPEERPRLVLVQ